MRFAIVGLFVVGKLLLPAAASGQRNSLLLWEGPNSTTSLDTVGVTARSQWLHKVRLVIHYRQPQTLLTRRGQYLTTILFEEINCRTTRHRLLGTAHYDADGTLVDVSSPPDFPWRAASDGSERTMLGLHDPP